jgi:hypothetical protein
MTAFREVVLMEHQTILELRHGYHVTEELHICVGHQLGDTVTAEESIDWVLRRPDGEEIWRFDPIAVLECELALTALEDRNEQRTEGEVGGLSCA